MFLNLSNLNLFRPNILFYAVISKPVFYITSAVFIYKYFTEKLLFLFLPYFFIYYYPIFSVSEIKSPQFENVDPNFFCGIFLIFALNCRKNFFMRIIFLALFTALTGCLFYIPCYFLALEIVKIMQRLFNFKKINKLIFMRNIFLILCAPIFSLFCIIYFLHKNNARINNNFTDRIIFDRATVKIKGHFGFLKLTDENQKLTTDLHDGSNFEIVKLHLIIFKNFYERATEELKIFSGDFLKIKNEKNQNLIFNEKENRFLTAKFSSEENENLDELKIEFLNGNIFESRKTFFRLKNKFNQFFTQMSDGSYSFSHYGKKYAQIFSIESCENSIKKFPFQTKWTGENAKLFSYKNLHNLYSTAFDGKFRRLKKNYAKNLNINFLCKIFHAILIANFYLVGKNFINFLIFKKNFPDMHYFYAYILCIMSNSTASYLLGLFSLHELTMSHENIFLINIFLFLHKFY